MGKEGRERRIAALTCGGISLAVFGTLSAADVGFSAAVRVLCIATIVLVLVGVVLVVVAARKRRTLPALGLMLVAIAAESCAGLALGLTLGGVDAGVSMLLIAGTAVTFVLVITVGQLDKLIS